MVSPVEFAGILNNLCKKYTNATLALECNSIGKSTLDTLWNTYEYDNIVNIRKAGSSSRGIFSNFSVKLDACIWFRDYLNMPECNIKLNDKSLLSELEVFERVGDSDKPIFRAASNMHDDYCMALIWGMFILNEKHVEKYFEVIDWHMATTNVKVPKKIVSYYSAYFDPNAMESITNSIVKKEITGQMDYATSNSPKSPSDEGTTIGFASF
jgi:hypothetical protein